MATTFKELLAWQRSIDLALAIYRLTAKYPDAEKFGLTSQMRRASVSISSNIAEGAGRTTTGEFLHFLGNARGSCFELESQFAIVRGLGFADQESLKEAERICAETGKLLNLLIRSLRQKPPPHPKSS